MSDCKVSANDALKALDNLDDHCLMADITAYDPLSVLLEFSMQNSGNDDISDERCQAIIGHIRSCKNNPNDYFIISETQ